MTNEQVIKECKELIECKYDWDYISSYLNDLTRSKDISSIQNQEVKRYFIMEYNK